MILAGYYVNPVANSANLILSISTQIYANSNGAVGIVTLATFCKQSSQYCELIFLHTRIGYLVVEPNADTGGFADYSTALGVGRTVSYMCYQSEGITNNATIIGNFSSLYTANNLADYYTTIKSYPKYCSKYYLL
jgi:uncharacterized membrane protein